jgi:hypothetical protein
MVIGQNFLRMFSTKIPEENVLLYYYVTYKGFKKIIEISLKFNISS